MWRRLPATFVARTRTPFHQLNKQQQQYQQFAQQNALNAAGADGTTPLYSEVVPSELIGIAGPQGLPQGATRQRATTPRRGSCSRERDKHAFKARASICQQREESLSCELPAVAGEILDDAKLNRHRGSLASVLVNNKAKDAPVFRYTDREAAGGEGLDAEHVRRQEVGIRDFLTTCPEFCELLSPTLPLLHRFLARHPDAFVWSSSPDMPTRVGLAAGSRYPHHSKGRHSDFASPVAPA
eukprot:gene46036-64961_t